MILNDYVAKSSQVKPQTDNKHLSAYQLMTQVEQDKSVKIVNFDVPYRQDVCLYDLSLNAHGQDEDKVYAFNEWYRAHIRRGNTVIQTFDSNDKVIETFYGRRGFEKFFDLTYEYIQYNLGEIKDLANHGIKEVDEHYELYHVIFDKAQQAIKSGKKVAAYKLVKANGENAQIAWVNRLGAWLIASKNVSLLARDEKDVETYKGERFHFAKLIAKEWFRITQRIEKDGQIEDLKKYMADKTFIGEYCGNQEYQHLVKYTQVDIHFTAIVENQTNVSCLAPSEAFAVFDKYKLTHVTSQKEGVYNSWESLNLSLKKIYSDVARANIDSEEEGSVIYLTQIDDKTGKEEVLSLCKLKTLEYRIYRKLREKLRNFISQKSKKYRPWTEYYKKFQDETKDLCLENQPPMPFSYYFGVAQKAFEFAEKHFKDCHLIHDQYITFLSLLMYHTSKKIELTPAAFVKETIDKILPLKWSDYYQNYVEEPEALLDENHPTGTKKIYVMVPIGMPGMGKTFFLKTLRKNLEALDCFLSIISSDEIRAECMERLAKTQRKLTNDQLFDRTGRDARNLFNERSANLIATGERKNCSAHFIFIDKNHPPNAIKGTLDLIKKSGEGLNLEVIALTPYVEDNFFLYVDQGRTHKYPFSANFFFNCLDRVQHRLDHPTLPGSGTKSANVLIMFFHMFRNVRLNKESVLKNGFDLHLRIPFTNEERPTAIPPELIGTFIDILKATQPGETCNDAQLLQSFHNINEKSQLKFNHPDNALVDQIIHNFVKEEILPSLTASKSSLVEVAIATGVQKANETSPSLSEKKTETPVPVPVPVEEKKEAGPIVEKKHHDSSTYNPKKLPIYLGLFTEKDPFQEIKNFVLDGLDRLCYHFPKDKILEVAYYDISDRYYRSLYFLKDFHVTTLFIGKDKTKTETEHFKTFKPNHKMSLQLIGFVIVPGKIVTAICYPDQSTIKIENEYPHMTLMTGKWAPKDSNELFTNLFGNNGPLNEQYHSKKLEKEFAEKVSVTIRKHTETAYIIVTNKPLKLSVISDAFF